MLVDPFRDLTAADAAPWVRRRLATVLRPARGGPGPPGVHAQVHRLAARPSSRDRLSRGEVRPRLSRRPRRRELPRAGPLLAGLPGRSGLDVRPPLGRGAARLGGGELLMAIPRRSRMDTTDDGLRGLQGRNRPPALGRRTLRGPRRAARGGNDGDSAVRGSRLLGGTGASPRKRSESPKDEPMPIGTSFDRRTSRNSRACSRRCSTAGDTRLRVARTRPLLRCPRGARWGHSQGGRARARAASRTRRRGRRRR